MRTLGGASVVVLALVAGGCKKTVKTGDVVAMVVGQLAANGIDGKVTCPDSVEAKAGAHFQCTATVDGEAFTVDVAITSVSGDQGALEATLPGAILRDAVVDAVGKVATDELGQAPTIDCGAKRLLRVADGKVTCAVDVAGHKGTLAVVVDARGTLGAYSIKFAEGPALVRTKLVGILTKSVGDQIKAAATVDCGGDPMLFPKDDQLVCQVSVDGKTARLVVHTKGDVVERWEIPK